MSTFITTTDYDASIHAEILDALTRSDATVIEVCEDRAISEMRSYLDAIYDCDALFGATGTDRHPLVLMMALDIAIYHIFCIHDPRKLSQIRRDRYDRAIEWLKAVSKGAITISGAPRRSSDELHNSSPYLMSSNKKHENHL